MKSKKLKAVATILLSIFVLSVFSSCNTKNRKEVFAEFKSISHPINTDSFYISSYVGNPHATGDFYGQIITEYRTYKLGDEQKIRDHYKKNPKAINIWFVKTLEDCYKYDRNANAEIAGKYSIETVRNNANLKGQPYFTKEESSKYLPAYMLQEVSY